MTTQPHIFRKKPEELVVYHFADMETAKDIMSTARNAWRLKLVWNPRGDDYYIQLPDGSSVPLGTWFIYDSGKYTPVSRDSLDLEWEDTGPESE